MNLILLVDISGSMKGFKIGAVNDTMENLIEALRDYSSANAEKVKMSVLLFSKITHWMNHEELDIESFEWREPECTGMTSLGLACRELAKKLKTAEDELYNIVLLSDGCPTDDYDEGIATLDILPTFVNSHRYAIAIGDNADIPSLIRFTADSDKVFSVSDLNNLLTILTSVLQVTQPQQPVNIGNIRVEEDPNDEWA